MKLPDDSYIRICGDYTCSWQRELYSKGKYIEVLKKLNEMLVEVKPATKGDYRSELDTFNQICTRLSSLVYDEEAEKCFGNPVLEVTSRNLEGVLSGKSLCEGVAEIARNAFLLKGLDAKFIKGYNPKSAHAWNQVKIGDSWFNLDLTWNLDRIPRLIKNRIFIPPYWLCSDEEFGDHDKYCDKRPNGEEICTNSFATWLKNKKESKVEYDI